MFEHILRSIVGEYHWRIAEEMVLNNCCRCLQQQQQGKNMRSADGGLELLSAAVKNVCLVEGSVVS
jgi:hypothetical protein